MGAKLLQESNLQLPVERAEGPTKKPQNLKEELGLEWLPPFSLLNQSALIFFLA